MEHRIKITPDEEEPVPFIMYFPRRSATLLSSLTPPPHPPNPRLEFSPQEHIMVIRQYVCIGINQQETHGKELWQYKVCL